MAVALEKEFDIGKYDIETGHVYFHSSLYTDRLELISRVVIENSGGETRQRFILDKDGAPDIEQVFDAVRVYLTNDLDKIACLTVKGVDPLTYFVLRWKVLKSRQLCIPISTAGNVLFTEAMWFYGGETFDAQKNKRVTFCTIINTVWRRSNKAQILVGRYSIRVCTARLTFFRSLERMCYRNMCNARMPTLLQLHSCSLLR